VKLGIKLQENQNLGSIKGQIEEIKNQRLFYKKHVNSEIQFD